MEKGRGRIGTPALLSPLSTGASGSRVLGSLRAGPWMEYPTALLTLASPHRRAYLSRADPRNPRAILPGIPYSRTARFRVVLSKFLVNRVWFVSLLLGVALVAALGCEAAEPEANVESEAKKVATFEGGEVTQG